MKLSLITKIPLRISLLILIVGIIVTTTLLLGAYRVFKNDLLLSSENMGRIISQSLTSAMLHDDTWKAYEIINTPFSIETPKGSLQADHIMVLDADNQVYVSTRPTDYPVLSEPTANNSELAFLLDTLDQHQTPKPFNFQSSTFSNRYVVTPIESDNVPLGVVVMSYSEEIFTNRFLAFAKLAAGTLLLMVLLILPLAIIWGRRTARPLTDLAGCMGRIGTSIPDDLTYEVPETGDEIEQLGNQFLTMVDELREKSLLEQQMVSNQRLVAIGRFTAGIAHEINNPLGGMLNAISTLKKHGQQEPLTMKTVNLLERGLFQIKETVSALLVEAEPAHHPLTSHDIEDTYTLVMQAASKHSAVITLNNEMTDQLPLPSTLIRQAIINLLLNAIEATPNGGHITYDVAVTDKQLTISVTNEGEEISVETLNHLFEPFSSEKQHGRGLGLWVTYQIVEKLHGDIEVDTGPEFTRFTLLIPIPMEDAA